MHMDKSKSFYGTVTGWCVGAFCIGGVPTMAWDKEQESFNGLITINSVFSNESEARELVSGFSNNPHIKCSVYPIEHVYTGPRSDAIISLIVEGRKVRV